MLGGRFTFSRAVTKELMQEEESELGHECVLNFTKFIKNRIVALSQNKPGKSLEFT